MCQDNIAILLKTWGQVIGEDRARLQFYQEQLEYQADKGAALNHLQEHYAKYLEGVLEDAPEKADGEATVLFSDKQRMRNRPEGRARVGWLQPATGSGRGAQPLTPSAGPAAITSKWIEDRKQEP